MKITERIAAAWRTLTGRRDFAGVSGSSSGGAGYAGGAINRLTASLAAWSGSINADLDLSHPVLVARARALAANNEHGKRFLTLCAINIVGRTHPRLQVRAYNDVRNPDPKVRPTLDAAANAAIETHWERWGRTADISGRHRSLYAILRTTVKAVARDGEALIRIVRDRRLPYGIGLQLLEADRLDHGLNGTLASGGMVRQGVEIDSALRAVAYYVKTRHPGENYATQRNDTERIPAGELLHLFLPERAEQVRGVTWLHAVIVRASRLHAFEEAAVTAAEVGAAKIAALERADDAADGGAMQMADGTAGGIPQMKVEAGEMFELPPGYKLSSWNPEYPHANFDSFLKACLRGLAAGLDVSAHNLTGDMTDVNYSSARIAELSEREIWMTLQDWLVDSCVRPLYEEWLAIALLRGDITFELSGRALPPDRLDKFRNAARFQGKRWPWVDPLKDEEANTKRLENRLTSRQRLAAEQGEEWEDILDELGAESDALQAAGLSPAPADPAQSPEAVAADTAAKAIVRAAELHRDAARALAKAPPPAPAAAPIITVAPVIHTPEVRNEITVQPAAAPEVHAHIAAPAVTVESPAIEVRVDAILPEQPAPTVEVHVETPDTITIAGLPERRTTTEIRRDAAGNIIESTQVERDA